MKIRQVFGVDFSGARLAGQNIWIADCQVLSDDRLVLKTLDRLEVLAGTAERAGALAHMVSLIAASKSALWGMDFPFALPIEVMPSCAGLADQLSAVHSWSGDAYSFGRQCLQVARSLGREMHIRRVTDKLTKTPFDCYHYRIICQTFHGMRDVLRPLSGDISTAIVPFQPHRVSSAHRIVAEACPGSTLKRLGLPHNRYKQPAGGPLETIRRHTRKRILNGLRPWVDFEPAAERIMMRNPGGDALDALIAAVGIWYGWRDTSIAPDDRYEREGRIYP